MFMIGSEILRFMMSPFYVRVAKAHAYLVSIFRLLKKTNGCSYNTRCNRHLGSDFIAYSRDSSWNQDLIWVQTICKMANGTSRRQCIPLCDFFFVTKFRVSNRVSIGWCSIGPDLGTNYLQSILSVAWVQSSIFWQYFLLLMFYKKIQHQRYRLSVIDFD